MLEGELLQEYNEIREEYYATLIDKKWKTLADATPTRCLSSARSAAPNTYRRPKAQCPFQD